MNMETESNLSLVQAMTQEIMKEWKPDRARFETSLLLMIGGLQGAGKTSILQKLSSEEVIIVISPDQIRKKLFTVKYPFSENFIHLVEQTNHELVKNAVDLQCSFGIDRNMTPQRIEAMKNLLSVMKHGNAYKIFSIFLNVPKDELIKRLQTRPKIENSYQGTLEELEAAIKQYGEIDRS